MAIDFGSNVSTIGSPTWDAPTDTISWAYATEGLLHDSATGAVAVLWPVSLASATNLSNDIWLELADPTHPVGSFLGPGLNVIACDFPVSADIILSPPEGFADAWYGNSNIQKIGVVRRKNVLHYDQPIWLNALTNAVDFGFPKGDSIEIILPPGWTGECEVFPWVGLPPTYANINGGTFVNSNLGWWFSPFPTS